MVNTGLCRGELQCLADAFGTPTCQRPAQVNQACNTQGQGAPNCSILQNNACIGGACVAITWVGAGNACTGGQGCNVTATCDQTSGQCAARPPAGSSCVNDVCGQGAYCDQGQCRAELTNGGACTASSQCAGALLCVGATGSRTCGGLNFMQCN